MQTIYKCFIVSLFMLLILPEGSAQRGNVYQLNFQNIYSGEAVDIYDLREKETSVGSIYYYEEWSDVHIKFTNGKLLSGYKGRYDLLLNALEVQRDNEVVDVPSSLIEEFLVERYTGSGIDTVRFVRLQDEELELNGFFEVLVPGEITLLKGVELSVLTPNYVATHDAGSQSVKYQQKEVLVVTSKDRVDKLHTKKKVSAQILDDYVKGCEKYILGNKSNFKKPSEVAQLIEHLNDAG